MLSDTKLEALAARLRRGQGSTAGGLERRPPGTAELPLSFAQEQLWFLDRFAPDLPTYNIPFGLRLRGALDVGALSRALDGLVARHEALRTRLVPGADDSPLQVVDDASGVALAVADLSDLGAAELPVRLAELTAAEAARPFVLAEGPLFRAHLVRLATEEHLLLIVVHHIVFDGWSLGVLVADLMALYEAEPAGAPAEIPVQFADYALWERGRLRGAVLEELIAYWRTTLEGCPTLEFPTDRPRPMVVSHAGAIERLSMGAEVLAGLRELSRREGATLFVAVLTAVNALLHRYTGQDDIVVGTVSANRGRAKLAPLIGFLVNMLPVRTDLSGDPSFAELLGRVQGAAMGAYAHQDLPFARLVDELRAERDPSRTPVFQVGVSLDERPGAILAGGLTVSPDPVDLPVAKFDLNFRAEVHSDELWVEVSYATALFDADTVRRLLGHLRVLLAGVVADPGRRLSVLPVLTDAELHRELVEWNDTAADFPVKCIHEGFEEQVRRDPDGVAAELDGELITYAELNADANRIARWLNGLGVVAEVLVGVAMVPSVRRLAVLLGILKAGGGYVPLDPGLPVERLSYMARDAATPMIISDSVSEPKLAGTAATAGVAAAADVAAGAGVRVLTVDREWAAIRALEAADPGFAVQPSNLAYVIYTSGSTGRPKGVMVEHRQVANYVAGMIEHWGLGPADRILQFASLSFDASVMDMFVALTCGARAVLAARETLLSPPRLARLMRDRRVTFACMPPAVISLLAGERFPELRIFFSGGEELPAELQREWTRHGLRFVNDYGPTEVTVAATFAELDGTVEPPPIGLPVPGARAYVLDRYLNPAPVGVVGELHVGGAGVARGYLNSPELTARRFVSDPFQPGARLYKTGDLVRRLPDGNLVYVGRMDGQVKIRGLRVELGEIESALVSHPAVAQAVLVVAEDRAGAKQLVGYVRFAADGASVPSEAGLRAHLVGRLPAYMVPARLVTVESFPFTVGGKIDKSALPGLDTSLEVADYTAPRTGTETALAGLFARLLGYDRVGVDDGFFDLGGNSLQAMQLIAWIHREFAADLGVTTVFLAPTVRELAVRIDAAMVAGGDGSRARAAGPLIELTEGDAGEPLFIFHAVRGTVYGYAQLATELIGDFKVHGVEAAGLAAGTAPATSMNEMVARYTEVILAAQPEGPYRLGGWSMGGLVAFEVARRLEQAGERVAFLALLDAPFATSAEPGPAASDRAGDAEPPLAERFVADAVQTLGWAAPDPALSPDAKLDWLVDRLAAGAVDAGELRAEIGRRFALFTAHIQAIASYRPEGTVRADTLIVSARHSPNTPAALHWAEAIEGKVTITYVDSDHYSFLRLPLVAEVAATIKQFTAAE